MPSDIPHHKDAPDIKESQIGTAPDVQISAKGRNAIQGNLENPTINEPSKPGDAGSKGIAEAARRGAAEETGYINKIGRANEESVIHQLRVNGEQVTDLNSEIKKNHPVVDISTDQRLVSVKGTVADSWDSQYRYLQRGFGDMYSMTDGAHTKRLSSSQNLAAHAKDIHLPTGFKEQFTDTDHPSRKELSAGAEYIRKHGEYRIPSDKVQPFKEEINPHIKANLSQYGLQDPRQVDSFLDQRVISSRISSGQVKKLVEES